MKVDRHAGVASGQQEPVAIVGLPDVDGVAEPDSDDLRIAVRIQAEVGPIVGERCDEVVAPQLLGIDLIDRLGPNRKRAGHVNLGVARNVGIGVVGEISDQHRTGECRFRNSVLILFVGLVAHLGGDCNVGPCVDLSGHEKVTPCLDVGLDRAVANSCGDNVEVIMNSRGPAQIEFVWRWAALRRAVAVRSVVGGLLELVFETFEGVADRAADLTQLRLGSRRGVASTSAVPRQEPGVRIIQRLLPPLCVFLFLLLGLLLGGLGLGIARGHQHSRCDSVETLSGGRLKDFRSERGLVDPQLGSSHVNKAADGRVPVEKGVGLALLVGISNGQGGPPILS